MLELHWEPGRGEELCLAELDLLSSKAKKLGHPLC